VRTITAAERRARLVHRHHLAPATRAGGVVEVARDLVALHSTDPASVFLSAWARLRQPTPAGIEAALYEDRELVRILGMRRTMFVVPLEDAPVVQAACTRAIAADQRRRLVTFVAEAGHGDARWLADVEAATLRALDVRGSAFGGELVQDEPRLAQRLVLASGKKYEAEVNLTSRVLFLMAADGLIVRGRPRGTWISSQFRWHPMESWLPGGLGDLPVEAAQARLARRWLAGYGPGTAADLRWWTGWSAKEAQRALAAVGAVEVDLEGATGFVLKDDLEVVPALDPAVALLPALDPTIMGWTERDWYLGPRGKTLFDRSGNPCATVWWGGRVVGAWAQRKDGEIVHRLFEDVGAEGTRQVESEAARLREWIGEVRVTPRFRTPLEKELSAA
jgi:Winged helix DNA-binding domain